MSILEENKVCTLAPKPSPSSPPACVQKGALPADGFFTSLVFTLSPILLCIVSTVSYFSDFINHILALCIVKSLLHRRSTLVYLYRPSLSSPASPTAKPGPPLDSLL